MACTGTVERPKSREAGTADGQSPAVTTGLDGRQSREKSIFDALQRRPQLRHRQLAYDIDRLLESAVRLKAQVCFNASKNNLQ
jgi:hypothetical protein